MVEGEDRLGDDCYQYWEDILQVKREAMWEYLRVARAFPQSMRVDLEWSHHRLLAGMRWSPQERADNLALAKAQELSSRELAAILRPSVEREKKCCK